MNDFDFENLEKKRIARNARYKKRGSKSKKCPMSTDYMTQRQWKELNGEVMSYQLNKPMGWDEFKSVPIHIQLEYLTGLIERYGVNTANLAEMFGVHPGVVRRHIQSAGLGITFKVGHSMTAAMREVWAVFLGQQQDSVAPQPCHEIRSAPSMQLQKFSLIFDGKLDAAAIANSILSMAGPNATGQIEIVCTLNTRSS